MGKFFLAGGILAGALAASGQVISPEIYQTEEDLLEGLQEGELTFDQYLEYLDLMRQKSFSDVADSGLVLETPDTDILGLDSINYEIEKPNQFQNVVKNAGQTGKTKIILQHGQKVTQKSAPETYFRIETLNAGFLNFYLETENQENENRIKRRAIQFARPGEWKIVLGNFQPEFGLGVNVGYRTYLNFSSDSSLEAKNTLLFPFWTRYNGLFGNYRRQNGSATFFYSQNRFGDYKDQVWGGEFKHNWKRITLAPIFSYQEISTSGEKFVTRGASLFAKLYLDSAEVSAEYAVAGKNEKGALGEISWRNKRKDYFQLSFWAYSRDFTHPTSGGRAMPDYRSIELEDTDLTFRNRQAGETGLHFSSSFIFNPRFRSEIAYQQRQDGNTNFHKNKARLGLGYWLKKNLELRVRQYFEDDDLDANYPEKKTTSWIGTFLFSDETKLQLRLNYRRSSLESGNTTSGWGEVMLYFPVKEKIYSKVRLTYRDPDFSAEEDVNLALYLTEKMIISQKVSLLAEFLSREYRDEDREDFQVVRVRLEWNL